MDLLFKKSSLLFLTSLLAILLQCSHGKFNDSELLWSKNLTIMNDVYNSDCIVTYGFVVVKTASPIFYNLYSCSQKNSHAKYDRPLIVFVGAPATSASGYYDFGSAGIHDLDMNIRDDSLLFYYDLLFIDATIGVGFSQSLEPDIELSRNFSDVAFNFVDALSQIASRNENVRNKQIYLYGESVGTKIIVESAVLLINSEKYIPKLDIQGIYLGSPWIDPINQILTWADVIAYRGFADNYKKSLFIRDYVGDVLNYYVLGNNRAAVSAYKSLEVAVNDITYGINKCNLNELPCRSNFEGRREKGPLKFIKTLLSCTNPVQEEIFKDQMINISAVYYSEFDYFSQWGKQERKAISYLAEDLLTSVVDSVSILLNESSIPVIVFTGQDDLIANPQATNQWLTVLKWPQIEEFIKADYTDFTSSFASRDDSEKECKGILGYKKQFGPLNYFNFLNTGHTATANHLEHVKRIIEITQRERRPKFYDYQ